jgi:hypothetical protein
VVYLPHQCDLLAFFNTILLVDTDGINPQNAYLIRISEMTKYGV